MSAFPSESALVRESRDMVRTLHRPPTQANNNMERVHMRGEAMIRMEGGLNKVRKLSGMKSTHSNEI